MVLGILMISFLPHRHLSACPLSADASPQSALSDLVFVPCLPHRGDMPLSRSVIPGRTSRTLSTSSSVLNLLRLRRKLPWATSWGRSIARRTCEGSREPDVQADPEEAQTPSKSRLNRK